MHPCKHTTLTARLHDNKIEMTIFRWIWEDLGYAMQRPEFEMVRKRIKINLRQKRNHLFLRHPKCPEGQSVSVIASQCILFRDLDRSSQMGDGLCLFNLNKRNLVGFSTKDPTVELDLVRHAVRQRVLVTGRRDKRG